jgi:hypothetical protein
MFLAGFVAYTALQYYGVDKFMAGGAIASEQIIKTR